MPADTGVQNVGSCLLDLLCQRRDLLGQAGDLGLDGLRFGMIGMPVSLIAMVVVSLMTEEPDAETQAMVDEVRIPSGKTILGSH